MCETFPQPALGRTPEVAVLHAFRVDQLGPSRRSAATTSSSRGRQRSNDRLVCANAPGYRQCNEQADNAFRRVCERFLACSELPVRAASLRRACIRFAITWISTKRCWAKCRTAVVFAISNRAGLPGVRIVSMPLIRPFSVMVEAAVMRLLLKVNSQKLGSTLCEMPYPERAEHDPAHVAPVPAGCCRLARSRPAQEFFDEHGSIL
jgi:hypothetical protein